MRNEEFLKDTIKALIGIVKSGETDKSAVRLKIKAIESLTELNALLMECSFESEFLHNDKKCKDFCQCGGHCEECDNYGQECEGLTCEFYDDNDEEDDDEDQNTDLIN